MEQVRVGVIGCGKISGHYFRGLGVADLACAARRGRPPRAGGELALHVLDVMHAIHEAAAAGRQVELTTTCERPAPLPLGLLHGELD